MNGHSPDGSTAGSDPTVYLAMSTVPPDSSSISFLTSRCHAALSCSVTTVISCFWAYSSPPALIVSSRVSFPGSTPSIQ